MLRRLLGGVLGAVLLAGCTGTGDPRIAAEVNGETIAIEELRAQYVLALADPQVQQQLASDPDAERTIVSQLAGQLVQLEVIEQGAAELDIDVTDDDVDERLDEIIAAQFADEEDFEAQIAAQGLTLDDVRSQVRLGLLQERVIAALTEGDEPDQAAVEAAYAQQYQPTVRHILVATEEEALDVLVRLEGGEDFAAIAAEVSLDQGSAPTGGELGPLQPGQYVPEFQEAAEALEPGEISEPVPTDFGFHVIELVAPPPLEEVEEQVRAALVEQQSGAAVQAWLAERLAAADVVVNPRVGVWDAEAGQVTAADPLGDLVDLTPPGGATAAPTG